MIPLSSNLRQLHSVFPAVMEETVRVQSNSTCLKAHTSHERCSFPHECRGGLTQRFAGFHEPHFSDGETEAHRKAIAAGYLASPGGRCVCDPPSLRQAGLSSSCTAHVVNATAGCTPGTELAYAFWSLYRPSGARCARIRPRIALPVVRFPQGSSPHPQP